VRPAAAACVVAAVVLACVPARAQAQATSAPSTSWLQRKLETGLADALGGDVRIGRVDVDWTQLAATVRDVSISVPAEGAPPMTATIGEGRVRLAWEGLTGIAGGRIHITEVVAKGASFSISREWVDAWRPKARTGESAPVEIRIDKLIVEDAHAEYADEGQHLRVRANGLDLRGDWSTSRRSLVAEMKTTGTVEAPIFERPWTAEVRSGLRLSAGRLEIFGARAQGPGAAAELAGNVTWGAGASFTAEGRLDAAMGELSPYLPGHLGMEGHVEGPVQIVYVAGAPIRVTSQASTTGFKIGPVATDSARVDLTVRPGRLDVAGIDGRAYGGTIKGRVGLTFGTPTILETDLTGTGADLGRLIALAGKDLPVASAADVTFKIAGDPGHLATWTGGGTFDAVPRAAKAGGVPVKGRGLLTFDGGRVRVRSDRIELGEAALSLDLAAELTGSPAPMRLTLDGTTRDARATQLAALRFMDALGVARNRFTVEPVEGAGTVRAVVRTGRSTGLDLALDLRNGSWAKEPFDGALLNLVVDDASVNVARLAVSRGAQNLEGHLRMDARTGAYEDVGLRARGVGLADLLEKAGIKAPVDGRLDADLEGARVDGVFAAQGSFHAENVIVGSEILDTVDAPVRIEEGRIILDHVVARGAAVDLDARLIYDLDTAEASIDLDTASLRLDACRSLAEAGLTASGIVHAHGPILVGADGPAGVLSLSANDLLLDTGHSGVRELRLGDLEGTGVVSPRGIELSVAAIPASAWTFDAFLEWDPKLPVSAVLYFDDLLVGAGGAFGEKADLRLKGQVQAEGMLTDPGALEVNGAFDDVTVRIGPRTLRSTEPFTLRVESGRFALGPIRLSGDDATMEASASGSLTGGTVEGRLRGTIDLGIVSSAWSDLRGAGALAIDATLSGTSDRPDLRGHVVLEDGRLRILGYAQSLEHIDAEAVFEGQTLRLARFQAAQGGGEVTASGTLTFDGLAPSSFHARFEAANVSANFPEGFKGTYQGRIDLDGTPKSAVVSGRIDVVRGIYAKDFDLGITGGAQREFGAASESPFPRNIFLDIDLVAPGNVWLRNDIAKIEAGGQVHIGGELARPEVTGRLALFPGGTMRYRDVDYRVESGTIDLTDTRRINPYLDLRGRTRVAEYDVTLHVEGTLDKFDYELTSLPPLSSQDIISLLMTGKTLESVNSASAAAELPADMAAYYFAGLLNDTFGRQMQNSLGIDQFQITPLLLKGEGDPTARVTVGKRVSDAVMVVFSQDIGTAQKQTYQIVMDASRRVKVIAESDSESGVGGEVQYSQQFGGARVVRGGVSPLGADASGEPPGEVGSVDVRGGEGVIPADLVKAAKIRVGSRFDRGKMLEGGDRIRAKLLARGFLESDVRSEAIRDAEAGGVYRITYRLTLGPKVVVELVTADGKGKRSLRKALKSFWIDTPYTPDIWDEAKNVLLDDLQADGYYAADVTWRAIDSDAGRTVRFDVDRGRPVRLRSMRFVGVKNLPLSRVEAQVTSLQKKGALRKRLLRPEVLNQDLAAVRALYRDSGFTQVRVGRPEVTLSAQGDAADVRVVIEEGPCFRVGEVTFSDTTAAGDVPRGSSGLKPGETFSPRRLAEAEQSLREKFDTDGFPDATVETRVALLADTADVTFDVEPGGRKTIGAITIEGNTATKNRTIARSLTFGQGDVVSREQLLASQQRLYRTGLFSSVKLTFAPMDGSDSSAQRVTVRVEEAPPWTLGVGVGYDSEDGPRASFLLGYSNLFGRAINTAFQAFASSKDKRSQLTFRHRRLFGASIDSLVSLFWEKSQETGFTQWRKSLSFRIERRPKPRWITFLRYTIQEVQIGDITDIEEAVDTAFQDKLSDIRLASVGLGIVRDTRDDAFVPTRGGYGSIEGNVFAKPLGSEASFLKLFVRGSWVKTFRGGCRFMSFARIGLEQPFAGTELVPLPERFFAGGSSTLRGFALDSVGGLLIDVTVPSDPPGGPDEIVTFNTGGEAILVLNEEFHFPIWKSFHGELFLDVGNVYPTIDDFDVLDVRSDAGAGLRIDTPIGPIRLEYGWKLDRRDGESPGEFVFAIGALF
jgi:outer membrane protein insertion porin family